MLRSKIVNIYLRQNSKILIKSFNKKFELRYPSLHPKKYYRNIKIHIQYIWDNIIKSKRQIIALK